MNTKYRIIIIHPEPSLVSVFDGRDSGISAMRTPLINLIPNETGLNPKSKT
jgi:hypothetical protein